MERGQGIGRGFDFLTTIRAEQRIEVPADLLATGMEAFHETVTFVHAPLSPPMGNADTIMERLGDAVFGEPVETRLAAFANVSAAPIRLSGNGRVAGYYDLYVTLSPTTASPGRTTYHSEDGLSGTFLSELSLSPLFELRPLDGGESIWVDTGVVPIPGFPMRLGSADGRWTMEAPNPNVVRMFGGPSLFYDGVVVIQTTAEEGPLTKCDKTQAEFDGPDAAPALERRNFPHPAPYSNMELR